MSRNVDAEHARRSRVSALHPADWILPYFFAELIFLRRHNVFQLGLHLNRRKAGRIPAAAQGLEEEHARHQPLSVNHGERLVTSVLLIKALGGGWDASSLSAVQVKSKLKDVVAP